MWGRGDLRTARFTDEVRLLPPAPRDHLGRWSPTASGELAMVWEAETATSAHAPVALHVAIHDRDTGAPTTVFELIDVPLHRAMAQPLPEGAVLIAGAPLGIRSKDPAVRSRSARGAPNVLVYDRAGIRIGEGHLRHDITAWCTTASGSTWVAYGDQGVFVDGRVLPTIVRLDRDLQPDFEYGGDRFVGFLNGRGTFALAGEVAWVAIPGGDIVRVDPPAALAVCGGPRSVAALAIDGEILARVVWRHHALPRLRLDSLDGSTGEPWLERDLAGPDGRPLSDSLRVVGRDDTLHAVVQGGRWLRLRLADLAL